MKKKKKRKSLQRIPKYDILGENQKKEENMDFMISLLKMVLFVILICAVMYSCALSMEKNAMARYEYESIHDCRYDYNDMCYTASERPWLFE